MRLLSGVLKMKFDNLVELMHKNKDADIFLLDTVTIYWHLDELRRCKEEVQGGGYETWVIWRWCSKVHKEIDTT